MLIFDLDSIVKNEYYKSLITYLSTFIDKSEFMIGGGFARRCFEDSDIGNSDVDIFFTSIIALENFRSKLNKSKNRNSFLINVFNVFKNSTLYPENRSSSYAETVHLNFENKLVRIQLIKFDFFKSVEELFNSFDFTVCRFAIYNGIFYTTQESIDDLNSKSLRFSKEYSMRNCSLKRVSKYASYGFVADDDLIMKIIEYNIKNGNLSLISRSYETYFNMVCENHISKSKLKHNIFRKDFTKSDICDHFNTTILKVQ